MSKQIRTVGIVLGLTLLILAWGRGLAALPYLVSDALFLTGLVLLMIGAAGLVSNSGLFDLVVYGMKLVTDLLLNRPRQASVQQSDYAHYLQHSKHKRAVGLPLSGGAVFLLASAIVAVLSM